MNMQPYIIGIDGGGSKTSAILCTPDGSIVSEVQAGPSNLQILGLEKTADLVLDLIDQCCHSMGCTYSQIGVVAGLAGAGRVDDRTQLKELIMKKAQALTRIEIDTAARIALEGALSGGPGIVLIAGTGSIALAKNRKGNIFRAGGWGRIIGDEGSGYAIGRAAFSTIARSIDGVVRPEKIFKLFSKQFGLDSQEAILDAVYKNNFEIAQAAPIVLAAAEKGDAAAKKILSTCADELLSLLVPLQRALKNDGLKRIPVSYAGSLLTHDSFYTRILRTRMRILRPRLQLSQPQASPVVGAAVRAAHLFKQH